MASGFIKDISYETLNKLMIQTQPATMMTMKGKQLSAEERDILRSFHGKRRIKIKGKQTTLQFDRRQTICIDSMDLQKKQTTH